MRATPILLLVIFCLCSCVSKKTYEQQVGATASANRALEDLHAKNAELRNRLSKREAELEQRTREAKSCASQLKAANADLQRYEKEQQRLESTLSGTRQGATHAAERYQKRIERLQAEVISLKKQADSDRIACQARLANIKNTCDQLTGYLEQEKGDATAKAEGLKQDLAHCNGLRQDLRQQRDSCRQQLAKSNAVREDLKGQISALQAQFAALQGKLQGIKAAASKRQAALQKAAARLHQGLQQEIGRGGLIVSEGKERVLLRIGLDRLFADSETDLKPAGEALVSRIGKLLQGVKGLEIDIEGHGGRGPVSEELKKGVQSRWELSMASAVKVLYSLRLQGNIPKGRLAIVDFGPAPVLPGPGSENLHGGKGHIDIVLLPKREPAGRSSHTSSP